MQNTRLVILKFDDFGIAGRRASFMYRAVDVILRLFGFKGCWGVMGVRIESAGEGSPLVHLMRKLHKSGRYCFWNHGWTHSKREFNYLSEDEAFDHICKTQNAINKFLGLTADTFGAPHNFFNEFTKRAVERCVALKYWFYGDENFSGINFPFLLNSNGDRFRFEPTFFHPSYGEMVKNVRNVFACGGGVVLQAHPPFWGIFDLMRFVRCMIWLKIHRVRTIFPCELDKETVLKQFPKTLDGYNEQVNP